MKVYVAAGATDLRKSIDGLSILVAQSLELNPLSGHLFVFRNRRRDLVKVLYWDRNGYCLWQKRWERHKLRWPAAGEAVLEISWRELTWLLEGLEIRQQGAHGELKYSAVY